MDGDTRPRSGLDAWFGLFGRRPETDMPPVSELGVAADGGQCQRKRASASQNREPLLTACLPVGAAIARLQLQQQQQHFFCFVWRQITYFSRQTFRQIAPKKVH